MWAPGSHTGSGSSLSIRASRRDTTASASQDIWTTRSSRCSTITPLLREPQQDPDGGEPGGGLGRVEPHRRDAEGLGAPDVGHLVVEEHHVAEVDAEPVGQDLVKPRVRLQVSLDGAVDENVDVPDDLDLVDPGLRVEGAQVVGEDRDRVAGGPRVTDQGPGLLAHEFRAS